MRHVHSLLQPRQEYQSLADILDTHHRLALCAAVRLETALGRVSTKSRLGIANVELGAGDAVFATIERGGLCQAEDGML
jgi:hypothetical protein